VEGKRGEEGCGKKNNNGMEESPCVDLGTSVGLRLSKGIERMTGGEENSCREK